MVLSMLNVFLINQFIASRCFTETQESAEILLWYNASSQNVNCRKQMRSTPLYTREKIDFIVMLILTYNILEK